MCFFRVLFIFRMKEFWGTAAPWWLWPTLYRPSTTIPTRFSSQFPGGTCVHQVLASTVAQLPEVIALQSLLLQDKISFPWACSAVFSASGISSTWADRCFQDKKIVFSVIFSWIQGTILYSITINCYPLMKGDGGENFRSLVCACLCTALKVLLQWY